MINEQEILSASILIVDDQQINVELLAEILREAGYVNFTSTNDPYAVYNLHSENCYDLILLDLLMPGMDGFKVMEGLKHLETDDYLSVLVITAQPVHKLGALAAGAKDFITKPFDLSEIQARIHNLLEVRLLYTQAKQHSLVLEQTVLQLQQANDQLLIATLAARTLAEEIEKTKDQMTHLAQHDALTDLPNRILLNDRLAQAIALAHRQDKQFALLFLDLDRFKHINDSLGHVVGDHLLQSVGKRLMTCVRNSDTVCRQGGDEFLILLSNIEHAKDAALSAQKILAALTRPHAIDQLELHVSVSIGISVYPDDGQDADTLIKNADTAMYHAKEAGRNNHQFFEQNMNAQAEERHFIEDGLRYGLDHQQFLLLYQPKINLETGTISGVEALVRWQHPERGLILPENFISIAEDCGLIIPLGAWVLRAACQQAQTWQDQGLPPTPVAVNISSVQFRHKDFLQTLANILEDTRLLPCYLELELTESVLMHDTLATASMLKAIKDMGVLLAIDDFGIGYSSLGYLKRFPIDTLKIDKSFLSEITGTAVVSDDASIVAAVISMGKSLNQRVIAEGIETREQLDFLQAEGCGEGQGFYFSRPVTSEALVELLGRGIAPDLL
ncbi:MAG: EAL domain-containing protein [Methylococcaceae bacterium]